MANSTTHIAPITLKGYLVNSFITKATLTRAIKEIEPKALTTIITTAEGIEVDIGEVGTMIVDASAHSDRASTQWKDAAKAAYDLGIRTDMLTPRIPDGVDAAGKKKTKLNPDCNRDLFNSIVQYILAGISAAKPTQYFEGLCKPGTSGEDQIAKAKAACTWTVLEIANCSSDFLKGKQCDVFRTMRLAYIGQAAGTYMVRLRGYLTDLEFPDRKREARAVRAAERDAAKSTETTPEVSGHLLDRMAALLAEFNASVLVLKNAAGVTLTGVIEAQNAGLELAARIGQIKR
jgi:hypothetical protein